MHVLYMHVSAYYNLNNTISMIIYWVNYILHKTEVILLTS